MLRLKVGKRVIKVTDIKTDSRLVKPGDLFIAYKGVNVDSHAFIDQAIQNGAKYIIGEKDIKFLSKFSKLNCDNYIKVCDGRQYWALLEAQKYNNPERHLNIIGVTGTDGKTTTTHLIYEILKSADKKVALISTIGAKIGDEQINTGAHTTTPPPDLLFRLLSTARDQKYQYVILEITSHALLQKRVYNIPLIAAGITNVTKEHLDIHKTYENLIQTKASISNMADTIFLVKHTPGFDEIKQELSIKEKNVKEISLSMLDDYDLNLFNKNFPGNYNKQNLALAIAICRHIKIPRSQINKALKSVVPPSGRFQKIKNKRKLNIVVDFAHTPNSQKEILTEIRQRKKPKSKVITVFGAAGERDKYKRVQMGKVSTSLSDVVIITSEDPRSEDPMKIATDIIKGNKQYPFIVELNRKRAIAIALKLASPYDWVVILGKGHESSMDINGVEHKWSDINCVKAILKNYHD